MLSRLALNLVTIPSAPTSLCQPVADEAVPLIKPWPCLNFREVCQPCKMVNSCGIWAMSNIVLGCLCCTWWYGANRGICQMQSGVMRGRDRAGEWRTRVGVGDVNSLRPAKISLEHQLWGDKEQPLTPTNSMRTAVLKMLFTTNQNHRWDHLSILPFFFRGGTTQTHKAIYSKKVHLTFTNFLKCHEVKFYSKVRGTQLFISVCAMEPSLILLLFSKPRKRPTRSE